MKRFIPLIIVILVVPVMLGTVASLVEGSKDVYNPARAQSDELILTNFVYSVGAIVLLFVSFIVAVYFLKKRD